MEMVLDIYKKPYSEAFPVVCMDESPEQLIKETRLPIPASPGHSAKFDYEYECCGVCNIFLSNEPLSGKRFVQVTEKKTQTDWALFIEKIVTQYSKAKKIILVMDNYTTHKPGSLYEAFSKCTDKA